MMSARVLGLGPVFRQRLVALNTGRNGQVALRTIALRRSIQTQSLKASETADILNAQRIRRPSSPHFTIYQPQLTWVASIFNRATGAGLSVLLYGFAISYLVFPAAGLPFSSTDVVELVAALPDSVKLAGKAVLAAPFAFHSLNGLRHLAWDATKLMTVKAAYASGYAVLGATAVSTVALMMM